MLLGRAINGTELEIIFWTLFTWLNWFWQRFSFPLATEAEVTHGTSSRSSVFKQERMSSKTSLLLIKKSPESSVITNFGIQISFKQLNSGSSVSPGIYWVFSCKILFNSSSPTVANRPSAMFVYMKQKIQWRMFAKTCNLIGRLEMKSRLWLDNVETLNRPPEAHARWTHSEVQPRKYCLGQSAKSNIPYHLIIRFSE